MTDTQYVLPDAPNPAQFTMLGAILTTIGVGAFALHQSGVAWIFSHPQAAVGVATVGVACIITAGISAAKEALTA